MTLIRPTSRPFSWCRDWAPVVWRMILRPSRRQLHLRITQMPLLLKRNKLVPKASLRVRWQTIKREIKRQVLGLRMKITKSQKANWGTTNQRQTAPSLAEGSLLVELRHQLMTSSIRSLRSIPKQLLFLPKRWSKSTVLWHSSPARTRPSSNRSWKCRLTLKMLVESEERSGENSTGSSRRLRWLRNGRMRVAS